MRPIAICAYNAVLHFSLSNAIFSEIDCYVNAFLLQHPQSNKLVMTFEVFLA